jgi:KDO2-lipid IV(A) lauroyltransferase
MLKFILYWAAFHTLGRLPLPFLYGAMGVLASIAYRLAPGIRRNIDHNLRHVTPQASERKRATSAKRILRNVAFYYADVAHLPRMDLKHFFEERLVFHGLDEYLRPAIAEGKGVIILSAHYGNPELAVQGLAHLGIPVHALTEPVHPRMSKLMDEFRGSLGVKFEPVSVGSVKRAFKFLKQGGVLALMGDRDIEGPKEAMPFFGTPTLMPTGPIELGLRTGATVIPCFCIRKSKYVLEAWIEKPLEMQKTGEFDADVHSAMMEYITRLEARLRADPGQWAVLEAIWDDEARAPGDAVNATRDQAEVPTGKPGDG